MWTYDDRLIAEEDWTEYEKELSPDELAELTRRQEFERQEDYFEQGFKAMRGEDGGLIDNGGGYGQRMALD